MSDAPISSQELTDRRTFLRRLAAVSAFGASGYALARVGGSGPAAPGNESAFRPTSAATTDAGASIPPEAIGGRLRDDAVGDRVLVIVDLQGGNDGLSTLVPAGDSRYYDLRPTLGVPDADVLSLDDEVGLHPSLARLHRRGVTTVEGVGPISGDLSHFAMTERWQRGDVDGTNPYRTGFLGRLIDTLDDGSPLVGVSLAGPTPYLQSQQAAALSLTDFDSLSAFQTHDWDDSRAWLSGLDRLIEGTDPNRSTPSGDLAAVAGRAYRDLMNLAPRLDVEEGIDWEHPMLADGGELGRELYLAAALLDADVGVRVVYTAISGFDTHQDHQWVQADNLSQVDAAVDGFLDLMETSGRADDVVVATVTEFGRRVGENDSGLDHGTASTMLVAGSGVSDRRAGDRPDLGALDDDGNLAVTVGLDRYLAGLAEEWLGIEATSVLAGEPEPIGLL